jgi:uncharacterized protein
MAAEENNIHSPLDKAGLEKDEIRFALRKAGFSIAEKPASPCLASRLMTGVRVTEEKLHHIQKMEHILREAGLNIYRVRVHEERAEMNGAYYNNRYFRIEVAPNELMAVISLRDILVQTARKLGYRWVNLDLSGYHTGGGTLRA